MGPDSCNLHPWWLKPAMIADPLSSKIISEFPSCCDGNVRPRQPMTWYDGGANCLPGKKSAPKGSAAGSGEIPTSGSADHRAFSWPRWRDYGGGGHIVDGDPMPDIKIPCWSPKAIGGPHGVTAVCGQRNANPPPTARESPLKRSCWQPGSSGPAWKLRTRREDPSGCQEPQGEKRLTYAGPGGRQGPSSCGLSVWLPPVGRRAYRLNKGPTASFSSFRATAPSRSGEGHFSKSLTPLNLIVQGWRSIRRENRKMIG